MNKKIKTKTNNNYLRIGTAGEKDPYYQIQATKLVNRIMAKMTKFSMDKKFNSESPMGKLIQDTLLELTQFERAMIMDRAMPEASRKIKSTKDAKSI